MVNSFIGQKTLKLVKKSTAFTLVEVLITITVIGIVAAMTIPPLMTKINNKVKEHQIKVIEKRFFTGLNMYNSQDNGLSGKPYNSTEEFLRGLSKYYKMSSICGYEKLHECWPYSSINYENSKKKGSVAITDIDLAELRLKNSEYYEPASFISAGGIPYIIALKKDCINDPDIPLDTYSSCIAGMYDYSGTKTPNKYGTDVRPFGDAALKEAYCIYEPNGVCMTIAPFETTLEMATFAGSNCSTLRNGGEITDINGLIGAKGAKLKVKNTFSNCPYSRDYWLAAKLKCESKGYRLPTPNELAKIAAKIYNYSGDINSIPTNWSISSGLKVQGDLTEFGFENTEGYYRLFSGQETSETAVYQVYGRTIWATGTGGVGAITRTDSGRTSMCVSD